MSFTTMISLYITSTDQLLPSPLLSGKRLGLLSFSGSRRHRLWKILLLLFGLFSIYALSIYTKTAHIGHDLRILPLDSITWGYGSTDWNGYREHLLEDLVGNHALFVGTETTGDMRNNLHEGRPGGRINTTFAAASWSLEERPNIILLHIGSNDLIYHDSPETAPLRFRELIEQIFHHCPDAVILAAKLGPSTNDGYTQLFNTFNAAIEFVVELQQDLGKHILLLDIPGALNVTHDLMDDLHPNDLGYKKMATAWLQGIRKAKARRWVADPLPIIFTDVVQPHSDTADVRAGGSPEVTIVQQINDWSDSSAIEGEGIDGLVELRGNAIEDLI